MRLYINSEADQVNIGPTTMKTFFLPLSLSPLLSWLYGSCPLGFPPPQTSWVLPLPSSYLLLSRLGRHDLVWKRIRLLSWAKHQIRALTLCIILCMTLTSALLPLSFYPSPAQCAQTWSVLLLLLVLFYYYVQFCLCLLHVGMCVWFISLFGCLD